MVEVPAGSEKREGSAVLVFSQSRHGTPVESDLTHGMGLWGLGAKYHRIGMNLQQLSLQRASTIPLFLTQQSQKRREPMRIIGF